MSLGIVCVGCTCGQVLASIDDWCDEFIAGLRDHGAAALGEDTLAPRNEVRLVGFVYACPAQAAAPCHAQEPYKASARTARVLQLC